MKGCVLLFGDKCRLSERIEALGYEPIVIDFVPSAREGSIQVEEQAALAGTVPIEPFGVLRDRNVQGVLVTRDYLVDLGAAIREAFFPHLPGFSSEIAERCRDKLKLKQWVSAQGFRTADYLPLNVPLPDYECIAKQMGGSFLVKPRRGVLARGISVIRNAQDWAAWNQNISDPSRYYLESYLEGVREYCCDTIVVEGEVVLQFPGEYSTPCLNSIQSHAGFGVDFPGFLPEDKIDALKELAKAFVKKMSIERGFCHIEFFYLNDQWFFSEVGLRIAGGHQIPTQSFIAQGDLLDLFIQLFVVPERVNLPSLETSKKYFGYYLYPNQAGTIVSLKKKPLPAWVREMQFHARVGDRIEWEDSSVAEMGHVIYQGSSSDELRDRARLARDLIEVQLEP